MKKLSLSAIVLLLSVSSFSQKKDPEIYAQRARSFAQSGQYERAIRSYDTAISIDAKSYIVYNDRGICKAMLKDYAGAVEDYNMSLAMHKGTSDEYYNRGIAKYHLSNYKLAILDFDRSISLGQYFPEASEAYLYRGYSKIGLKDFANATGDFTSFIKQDSTDAGCYANRGLSYLMTGKYKEALPDFDRAILLNKDTTELMALNCRGQVKYLLGDYRGALADLDIVIRKNQRYENALHNRMTVKIALEDEKGACMDYRLALSFGEAKIEDMEEYCK